jgi:hypothetical protein
MMIAGTAAAGTVRESSRLAVFEIEIPVAPDRGVGDRK